MINADNFIVILMFFTDKSLNNIAINVYNRIHLTNPAHPLFEYEDCLEQVIERGKYNIDHDLFNETSSIIILETMKQIIFSNEQLVCYCNNDLNCFLLQQVYFNLNNFIIHN